MPPSHSTEVLLRQFLAEQKAQTAYLQRIAFIQEEHSARLLAIVYGSGKQLDQLERQVVLLEELVAHVLQRRVIPATEAIEPVD